MKMSRKPHYIGQTIARLRRAQYEQKPCQKIRQNAIVKDELSDGRSQAEYWLETGYGLDDDLHLYP